MKHAVLNPLAKGFLISKYGNPKDFKKSSAETKYCAYKLTFIDGSSVEVVMSSAQRTSIKKRKDYHLIKSIGGLGYMEMI
jgi:hypothetical protein